MDTDSHGLGGEKECSTQFLRPNFRELIFSLENRLFIRVHPCSSVVSTGVFRLFRLCQIARKTRMKSKLFLALLFLAFGLSALKTIIPARAEPASDAQIKRGQYLVERVAMCGECHTPKTDKGEYDRTAWLQGDVLDYKPVHPMPFAAVAPGIAGLPTFATDELAMKFMETGTNALDKRAMPPMPQFRFNHDDAVAVVAYLRSLKR